MVVYKIAQLGTGWAVFRIQGRRFAHVEGPYPSRNQAITRQHALEQREAVASRAGETSCAPVFDD